MEGFGLDHPLLAFSDGDIWTVRDACEGTQIFGGTGSGKTSGSGRALALSFLRAGYGGLVLTVKPDECQLWEEYAEEAGRKDAILRFAPDAPWRFNFLDYELRRPGAGAGFTENLVGLFTQVLEVGDRSSGSGRKEEYWQRALKQLLRNAIELCKLATGRVSLPDLNAVVQSAAQTPTETRSQGWQEESRCFAYLDAADTRVTEQEARADFELTARYWLGEFPALAQRTRSIIVSSFTGMADGFLRAPLRELFCTTTSIVPELSQYGAVLVLDLPVKEFSELGQFAQVLFKLIWQRAAERRDVVENPRPVFLWADEAQNFICREDLHFQATARGARVSTVYLTQNLPNYYAVLDPMRGKHEADALLGNLQTRIFHANGDRTTNEWAAESIAKTWQFRANASSSVSQAQGTGSGGEQSRDTLGAQAGGSQQLQYQVLPHQFATLAKGGPDSECRVEAIVSQGGRIWHHTGTNYLSTWFQQRGSPGV